MIFASLLFIYYYYILLFSTLWGPQQWNQLSFNAFDMKKKPLDRVKRFWILALFLDLSNLQTCILPWQNNPSCRTLAFPLCFNGFIHHEYTTDMVLVVFLKATLPETKPAISPLKIGLHAPKGNASSEPTIHFQGRKC